VEQVSRPVLIALLATVALAGAWFTVLRPKDATGGAAPPVATAPGQAGLERSIDKANGAVAASKASADKSEQAAAQAADGSGATSAPVQPAKAKATAIATAKPAVAAAKPRPALPELEKGDRSGPILRNLADGKVVVALFFNPHGADDNAALRAVRAANRRHGRVIVHSIPVEDVGDYNALTTGVQVLQAPTVLVIGPDHKARTISGYTEVKEIDQMVFDIGGFGKRKSKHAKR
jgi:hypothetical protein